MTKILYGDVYAQELKAKLKEVCEDLKPVLAVVLVGDDYGSIQYTKQIVKNCEACAVEVKQYLLKEDTNEEELLNLIEKLNEDVEIDGIIVQLPLPKHLDKEKVIEKITPAKDVDGVHPTNLGRLLSGQEALEPCTAKAVMRMLEYYEVDVRGKNVVIAGRSNSVGKPLLAMMLKKNATVTICHSHTRDLYELTKKSDIMIAAIGRAKYFTEEYFQADNIVIDVGINMDEEGLCGDVDYSNVVDKVKAITPDPKGVGSLTIAMLIDNLVEIKRGRQE